MNISKSVEIGNEYKIETSEKVWIPAFGAVEKADK